MTGILLLNGQPPKFVAVPKGAYIICADGAYSWAHQLGVNPNLTVGDFDSLGYVPIDCETIELEEEKNETDGEFAIKLFKEKNCTEVFVYGALGRRTDHFLGNLALLGLGYELGIKVVLVGDDERISLGCGEVKFKPCDKKGTISLVPYGETAHIINSKGLYYPLEDLVLTKNYTRGISNVACDEDVEFFVEEGKVLILESWRE